MPSEDPVRPLILAVESPLEGFDFPSGEYRLVTASDPETALASALALCPDLILCAGCRPDLLTSFRAMPALEDTAIVMVTARADASDRVRLLQSGADDIVAPELREELRLRVDSLLRARIANQRRISQLAEADRELQALTYAVSHDLQAPLRAVQGFSDALSSDYQSVLGPGGLHLLERVTVNAQRMKEMLDGLLELSRLFREPFQQTRLDLSAMATRLSNQLRTGQPARTVEVAVADGLWAWGDARLVKILWKHLLGNAWKFTAPRADAKIEVGQEQGVFFVRDNGVGYDMRYAEKLFTPFQRLHGKDFEGSGIGLASAARIVSRHGGKIWGQATVGGGATFFFTL